MNRCVRVLTGLVILAMMLAISGCTKLQARDQLNKGVQSYKNARYEEAIQHFKRAVELDPKLLNARLYLATAYAQQYIPGADTEDNNRMATSAIEEYKNVLQSQPDNVGSVKGIAYLYLQMKKFEEAKEYYKKASAIDPRDPETYYSVAVIDWTEAYQPRMQERANLGLKPTDPLKDKKACETLKTKNETAVEEGIDQLQKAIKLRPDYDDAMAYLNLLYRERADYNCDSDQSKADLQKADEWVDKTMATKKAKAEKAGQSGIVMDQNK